MGAALVLQPYAVYAAAVAVRRHPAVAIEH